MQHPIGVRRLNILGVDCVAQLQLPREGSLRPLGDHYALALLVFRAPLCLDRQDVPLGGDVHTVWIHPRQVEADMESVLGLSDIHGHSHRGPSPRQQLVREPIHLAKRVAKRVESQHTHMATSSMRVLKPGVISAVRVAPPKLEGT
jgi:hypothetical protein